ncbi:MAG: GNAT family N-acetyltransferase [Acidimicrobiales bacterium]
MSAAVVWPLFGLELTTPRVLLRAATESDIVTLAAQLPPDLEVDPSRPHHPALPTDQQRAAGELQQYWRNLGTWTATSWEVPFVVAVDGRLVGTQTLEGEDFPRRRVVETASWLLRDVRGRGIGRDMRAAVLHLAFEGLGAQAAVTSAWADNARSLGVSRSLGYIDNGYDIHVHGDHADRMVRLIMTRPRWLDQGAGRPEVEILGLEACLPLFGLA